MRISDILLLIYLIFKFVPTDSAWPEKGFVSDALVESINIA